LKAAVITGNNKIEMADIPKPEIKNRKGAIIKTIGCGVCGSDIIKIKRNLVPSGTVLGHEVVGIIEQVGLDSNTSLKVGERIAVTHHVPCNNCRYCQQYSYSMCETFRNTNLEPGGFAEYIYISDAHLQKTAIKVPENLTDLQAAATEPAGCMLRAIDRANINDGQNVLVIGLGFIGLLFVQALKLFTTFVAACDLINERIDLARRLGADFTLNSINIDEASDAIKKKIRFRGVDVVVLASGSSTSVDLALKTVRDGGTILVFSSIPDDNIGYFNNAVYYRELSIIGAYSSSPGYLPKAMNLLERNEIKIVDFYQVMDIDEINIAVEKTMTHNAIKVYLRL
jgi:L-iditol 2-dehydrogenase